MAALLDAKVVSRLDPAVRTKLRAAQYAKVGRCIKALQKKGFEIDVVNAAIRATFVTQSSGDCRWLFINLCTNLNPGQNTLRAEDLREVLEMLGESLSGEDMDSLFDQVDADGSGLIDFNEFEVLVKACNPLEGDANGDQDESKSLMSKLKAKSAQLKQSAAQSDTLACMNVLGRGMYTKLSPWMMPKVGRIVKNMQAQGFEDAAIVKVVKVVFFEQSDESVEEAFKVFTNDQGHIEALSFKSMAVMIGEEINSAADLQTLFTAVDTDGSGQIDLDEFRTMILAINPLPGKQGGVATSMVVLDLGVKLRLKPTQFKKVGRVIKRLQDNEYSNQDINVLVKAIFVTQSDDDLRKAYNTLRGGNSLPTMIEEEEDEDVESGVQDVGDDETFEKEAGGADEVKNADADIQDGEANDSVGFTSMDGDKNRLDGAFLRKMLHLIGEDLVKAEDFDALFNQVDQDGSGTIDFNEFSMLIKGINPIGNNSGRSRFSTFFSKSGDQDTETATEDVQKED